MKTSNKILLVAAIIPVLLFLEVSISLKIAFENSAYSDQERLDSRTLISRKYDLKGFNKLFFNGAWDIKIVQGSDYQIEINAPENILNFVSVQNIDDKLILNQLSGYQKSDDESVLNDEESALKIEISVPAVSDIVVLGACRLDLAGFRQDYLAIDANGSIELSVSNTQLTNLNLKGKGVAQWDLSKASVVNAMVDYDGKFTITLFMGGGKLSGALDGAGTLVYTGEADTAEMKIKNPLSRIVHQQAL